VFSLSLDLRPGTRGFGFVDGDQIAKNKDLTPKMTPEFVDGLIKMAGNGIM
jgi:hypothetical protein